MDLLLEAAATLEFVATACESEDDGRRLMDLAQRLREYLASSRPTTPIGMRQIESRSTRLTEDAILHASNQSHIRIVPS
jgi:hypothetical protein